MSAEVERLSAAAREVHRRADALTKAIRAFRREADRRGVGEDLADDVWDEVLGDVLAAQDAAAEAARVLQRDES